MCSSGRDVEYDGIFYEDNEGAKAVADVPLSSSRNKRIDVRWPFIGDSSKTGATRIVQIGLKWQHADIRTKSPPLKLFKRHLRTLMNMGDNK